MNRNQTLNSLLSQHNNDYGFDALSAVSSYPDTVKSLSIIIPYFQTGKLFQKTLFHLYNSINFVRKLYNKWKYEVIIVDDGSLHDNARNFLKGAKKQFPCLKLIEHPKNLGRAWARNTGLAAAQLDLCMLLDSGIFLDTQSIFNHLRVHSYNKAIPYNNRNIIAISLFEYTDAASDLINLNTINPISLKINDYRLSCLYQKSWIGCNGDKKFIGRHFKILDETNNLRKWRYKFGPWLLPLIVVGCNFSFDRKDAIAVHGFGQIFKSHGFTETTLTTKLIAVKNNFVVPVLVGGGAHIDIPGVTLPRSVRNRLFKVKHRLYFEKYLKLTVTEAFKDSLIFNHPDLPKMGTKVGTLTKES